MGKRTRTKHGSGKKMYLERNKNGQFKKWTNIGRSINQDKRRTGKPVKKGYGYKGDIKGKGSLPAHTNKALPKP